MRCAVVNFAAGYLCAQGEGEEEETDNLVNQVLDEIGIGNMAEVRESLGTRWASQDNWESGTKWRGGNQATREQTVMQADHGIKSS